MDVVFFEIKRKRIVCRLKVGCVCAHDVGNLNMWGGIINAERNIYVMKQHRICLLVSEKQSQDTLCTCYNNMAS